MVAELSASGPHPPPSSRPTSSSAKSWPRRWTPATWRRRRAVTCHCPRSSRKRCAFSLQPSSSTWPRSSILATVRWCSSAPIAVSGSRELAGLRRRRVDLMRGAVTVAEIVTEVKGKLFFGPPKTRASRRTVGLPPFVVRQLQAHLTAQGPNSHVFTASEDRCGSPAGALLGPDARPAGLEGLHPRPSAYSGGAVDRRWRDSQGSRRAGRPYLSQLHAGPLRPPAPGVRHHAP